MKAGALQLSDIRSKVVEIACDRCGRYGRYRRATLLEKYGPDQNMPDLPRRIAREAGCERAGISVLQHHQGCKLSFGKPAK
jgi:hypothetical protein